MHSKILLVDDEENVLASLGRALFEEPYQVHTATSGEQALDIMQAHDFKVVISDERMIGMQGSEFLALVRERYPDTVRIMLTGNATLEAAMRAVNQGEIYRFFIKPWDDTALMFAVQTAIEKFDLEAENRRLLRIIHHQALEMKVLEKRYPGISRVEKDEQGNLVLPDLDQEEIYRIMQECEQEV